MSHNNKRVAFFTLGCKLNFSETSTIARQFNEMGFERVTPSSEADIYIINTCSVTEHADKKCRQAIRKFVKQSPNAFVAVVGCYAQLKPGEIADIPGVDLVMGSSEKNNIPLYIGDATKNMKAKVYSCDIDALNDFFPAYSSADRTRSFLKVQDGCDYHCTYCTIPNARGKSRNIPIADVVAQAQQIASQGVKEIILTGVNTGDFGRTTGESFIDLLKALENVQGIERYRISSIEPNLVTNEIIAFVATSNKFLPHFHIPLQSGSNNVLKLMKRRYNSELFAEKVLAINHAIPNAFIGVDIIVGFPGESQVDFEQSYQLLADLKPSFLHVFPYSERPNTPAAIYEGKVKSKDITQWASVLQTLSNELHSEFFKQNIGRTDEVLFESARRGGLMYGFTKNYVKIEYPYQMNLVGQIVKVRLKEITSTGNVKVDLLQ
ncbi:MAG: tRNA (N(6)-L-threonylcarbamoyladenosine(37)-C(2))-methylthiotransferase MtaB [Bacteroidetes bacterium HGW-Bacteroidetes-15]|nr:MAG: tRNA (N(6)-L-threonylcarbamoyladenosine(37)-C(2))-methylthiotransferase MtaB [Bacteroidetes bacterium HGW-Bacteroidetes-15]